MSRLQANWETWARKRYGDDQQRVLVAAKAAVAAALKGASSEAAAAAGLAAVSALEESGLLPGSPKATSARPRDAGLDASGRSASGRAPKVTPRQGLVGRAVNVQHRQQLGAGTTTFTTEFLLETDSGRRANIVMRGTWMEGSISENDEIQVLKSVNDRGVIFASRVRNLSTNSEVRAGVGNLGRFNWFTTQRVGRVVGFTFAAVVICGFVEELSIPVDRLVSGDLRSS